MSITYHHYGAVLVDIPLDRLWNDLRDSLIALQWGDQATLEQRIELPKGTHTVTYRASASVLEIAEYVATCTLQHVTNPPHSTSVEWTRVYRPTAQADSARTSAFVARLRAQDQVIVDRFAAA